MHSNDDLNVVIVCIANFCRSPVAEKALSHLTDNHIKIISRGISQFNKYNMDERSQKFLLKKGINDTFHTPKKISYSDVESADLILLLDEQVYFHMFKKFRKFSSKFYFFNSLNKVLTTSDPYRSNDDDYEEIMNNIFNLCELWKIKLQENN